MTTPSALFEPTARERGTLAVIAGRDESARVYERFGRRIAFDGYVVGVFETTDAPGAFAWLATQPDAPRIAVGSDVGATAVLHALAGSGADTALDGAVLAGVLATSGSTDPAPDPAARTACPVHLGVLAEPGAQAQHAAAAASPPPREALAAVTVPVLAVHGQADPVTTLDAAIQYLEAIDDLTVVETVDGLHDALNDQSHRSVAAHLVLWLEQLRAGSAVVRRTERVTA